MIKSIGKWFLELKTILLSSLLLASLSITACSQSNQVNNEPQTIQQKNKQLAEAETKLLSNPQDKATLSQVVAMLQHDPGLVARANAASTLGTVAKAHAAAIKDIAVPALVDALENGKDGVPDAAAWALIQFGPLAKEAIPALRKSLVPSDTSLAWRSAEALGSMGSVASDAVPDLVKVVKDNQETSVDDSANNICRHATIALGKIGLAASGAVPDLTLLLKHRNPYLRARLAVALIRIDPTNGSALSVLKQLLKDQDVQVRRVTIWELDDSGKEAAPAKGIVRGALADADDSVRSAATKLLAILENR